MKKYIHNVHLDLNTRTINDIYNSEYINENGFLGSDSILVENLDVSDDDKVGAVQFMLVWLKNIDKLFSLIPNNKSINDYHFIDIGCGSGISTIYSKSIFNVSSYTGIDFSCDLIEKAKKNLEIYNVQSNNNCDIDFFVANAKEFKVPNHPVILFLFNPFNWSIMNRFITNNLDNLRQNNSILLYCNDIHVNEISRFGSVVARDDVYNLSVIKFD